MIKKTVNGMKDILPEEMEVRNYVLSLIRDTYAAFGFSPIDTPSMEHIENLQSDQGGENEKLIFKILKRGEKLKIDTAKEENDLVDAGLRYDLTVPLARYYSNNSGTLPVPFKALQTGNVWRADRPQRGRFRQFTQCDIDILGEDTCIAEIELITATSSAISRIGFENFTIRINDRRILKAMASYCGFEASEQDRVFIILDKMDKIGLDGVREELIKCGYDEGNVDKYLGFFVGDMEGGSALNELKDVLKDEIDPKVIDEMILIINTVENNKEGKFTMQFDPALVRGMSYYTGPIFEISMDEYGGSVGGGGRYDEMIGKFIGNKVSACGFSIGFERIIMLLMERGFKTPGAGKKTAFLIDKKASPEKINETFMKAAELRAKGECVTVSAMKKNKRFQKEQLESGGYDEIIDIY